MRKQISDFTMTDYAIGPDGKRITRANLPKADGRWTPKRKAAVIAAVRGEVITQKEAAATYGFTESEFNSLSVKSDAFGVQGLRITQTQQYRK